MLPTRGLLRQLAVLVALVATLGLCARGVAQSDTNSGGAADTPSPDHAESADRSSSDTQPSTEPPSSDKESPGDATSDESDVPPPDSTSPDALLQQATEIAEQVASIRGLPLKHEVAKGVKNRKELRQSIIAQFEREYGKQRLVNEGAVLRKLGMIDDSVDWYQTLVDLMTEQVAGYYDQRTDELFIMRGLPTSMQRPAMAHELYHAVQDQHFDLQSLLKAPDELDAGDATLAGRALVEGDAVVTMIDFFLYEQGRLPVNDAESVADLSMYANALSSLPERGLGALEQMAQSSPGNMPVDKLSDSALGNAPRILRQNLIFPYLWGMRWVIRLKQGRTWAQFNDVYDHPPISTEQILHPEAYAEGDDPVHVSYRAESVLDGYDRIYRTSLGEFQMRIFLQEHLPTSDSADTGDIPTPTEAAAGWDGDRILGFRNDDGDIAVTHLSVWDSTAEADQYFRALQAASRRRFPDAQLRSASGPHGESLCLRHGTRAAGERVYLERWGDAVLHIEGAPSSLDDAGDETNPALYRARDYIWKTLERKPLRKMLDDKRSELAADDKDKSNADTAHTNGGESRGRTGASHDDND